MLETEEKQRPQPEQPQPEQHASLNASSQSSLLSPLHSMSARLKHFFPLVKSRSSSNLHPTLPAIVTTAPTAASDISLPCRPAANARLSSSSLENNPSVPSPTSSARTSSSVNLMNLANVSQTHLHVVTSSTVAAAIGGSNRIRLEDAISIRLSDEGPNNSTSSNVRTSDLSCSVNRNASEATSSNPGSKENFLQKIFPTQFIRRPRRRLRRKNDSVSSVPEHSTAMTNSAPSSPKFSAQSTPGPLSNRSSDEDRCTTTQKLPPPPRLPALRSTESLPSTSRPIFGSTTNLATFPELVSSPQRTQARGRSTTVSSVSSDVVPRASHSRTRRTYPIFTNLIGRDSGRGTPTEKLSLDNDDEEQFVLPPIDTDSGEEYFRKLQLLEESLFPRSIKKLVESDDPIHISALTAYLETIAFAGLPLDMAMRYLLLHLPLPREQGAIYRLLELFAKRYHMCNPLLWDSRDHILVVCYSILMLNTDAWNSNNKIKMTKEQYIKNTIGQGASEDILSCWYDNITLAPFVDSAHPTLSRLQCAKAGGTDRPSRPMLDIYTPLLEFRLDELKIVYSTKGKEFTREIENNFHYTGMRSIIPVEEIHSLVESSTRVTLLNRGRSKSEGFALTRLNVLTPFNGEAERLVKVGIYPRRERVARFGRTNTWQWVDTGIVLLESKIMFIKGDLSALKNLMNTEQNDTELAIPPLGNEIILDLVGSIAFYDSNIPTGPTPYTLRLVSRFGDSDIFNFPNDEVLNEWIALINYLATVSTAQFTLPDQSTLTPELLLRRRAGTTTFGTGHPITLRAVSSTVELRNRSKSEQPSSLPTESSHITDKFLLYSAFQKDLEAKLPLKKMAVDSLLRQARGLLIQTPFQDRTRLEVLTALERVCRRLRSGRIEMERAICYVDVLTQIMIVMGGRQIRIVEKVEMEDFHLPALGFMGPTGMGHRKNTSDGTVDTMLSSTTLYGALHPVSDIGVPIRRIGTLSRNIRSRSGSDTAAVNKVFEGRSTDGTESILQSSNGAIAESPGNITSLPSPQRPPMKLEKCESAPGIMNMEGIHSLRAEKISDPREEDEVGEIAHIIREGVI